MTTQQLTIPRGPIELAGQLYLPDDFDATQPRAAVVISTPGSSVKEQIGANYGARLAHEGFVVLAFDPGYQGQSGGVPRDLEDPYARSADISFAIDALSKLDFVDQKRIGILGICAGGGYAVHAARTEHRIKAVGTVVPSNIGRAFRQANVSPAGVPGALDQLAEARAQEVIHDEQRRVPWLPDPLEQAEAAGLTDIDTMQAITYYRTPRGQNDYSTNRRLLRSDALLLGFDAFHLVSELLTQPLQVIVGGRIGNTGSYFDGMQLWEQAPNKSNLLVIDGAGHYEMYDVPQYVDQAVERLGRFYREQLTG
jgi:fermentation-respiration switch protein FrsA (DUF1100 family)